jgi:SAM-dependent methyltransferase
MHQSSFDHMQDLAARYLDRNHEVTITDIGSHDVNGSYRPIFDAPSWSYCGVDLCAGPNVDVVLSSPYRFPFATASFDLVVSGQAFEHIDYFWLSWLEMVRILRPEGLIFLIAPSRGPEHRYPVDCWRFFPDAYRALARWGEVEAVEINTDWSPHPDPGSAPWGDTVGVFRRGKGSGLRLRLAAALIRLLLRV